MKTLRVALAMAILSLPACYDFDFPLDPEPRVPVDARLVGTWRCLSAESDDPDEAPATLNIERRSEMISRWTLSTPAGDGTTDKGEFDTHRSALGDGSLLNAIEAGEKARARWSFVRYTLFTPNVLRVQLVDDEPFKEVKDNAARLREAVERRVADPEIYQDFFVCVRVKDRASPGSPMPSPSSGG